MFSVHIYSILCDLSCFYIFILNICQNKDMENIDLRECIRYWLPYFNCSSDPYLQTQIPLRSYPSNPPPSPSLSPTPPTLSASDIYIQFTKSVHNPLMSLSHLNSPQPTIHLHVTITLCHKRPVFNASTSTHRYLRLFSSSRRLSISLSSTCALPPRFLSTCIHLRLHFHRLGWYRIAEAAV